MEILMTLGRIIFVDPYGPKTAKADDKEIY